MIWVALAPLSVAFTVLAMLLAPVIALFVRDGHLPRWLTWFDTPDNPTIGDLSFQQNQMAWTKSRYLYALFWLWRNPAYGFDHAVGAKIKADFKYGADGDEEVNNTPLYEGWVFRTVLNQDGSDYWQFLAIYGWSKTCCIKINLGWKLWTFNKQDLINAAIQNAAGANPPVKALGLEAGQVRQLVCTVNPFTKYE